MKPKKIILRRITTLYVIFFVVIGFSLVRTLSQFSGEEFNTGINDAQRVFSDADAGRRCEIIYDIRTATSSMDFNMPIYADSVSRTAIYTRPAALDVELSRPEGTEGAFPHNSMNMVYGLLGTVIYLAIFIILFIVIGSLRKSIRHDDAFPKSNIALTRAIGILLIVASLVFSLISWLEAKAIAPYFEGSAYQINTSFPFNFSEIIVGILIFVIAEVFAIGTSMSEEQKLTI